MPGSLRCYNFPLTGDYVEYQATHWQGELIADSAGCLQLLLATAWGDHDSSPARPNSKPEGPGPTKILLPL